MPKFTALLAMSLVLLSACSTGPLQPSHSLAADAAATRVVTAVGYGAPPPAEGHSQGKLQLMAMRASKLDAYRALAEEVQGVRINGLSTVSSLSAQHDSFRARVDAYVRGAKVVSVTPMSEGNYETVLELRVSEAALAALAEPVGRHGPETQDSCGMRSAVGPGCAYRADFYHAE